MRIEFSGFKATDRRLEFDPKRAHLLVAPNGTGKSAVADAFRFLALGYVPHLGKRHQDTALLMRGHELWVQLSIDDRAVARRLTRTGNGYTMDTVVSWMREGSAADRDVEIAKLFGEELQDAAEALDARELLTLTPAKRAARVEKIVGQGAGDPAQRMARLSVARVLDWKDQDLPADISKALPMLKREQAVELHQILGAAAAGLAEKGIAGALSDVRDIKSNAEHNARGRTAAREKLGERIAEIVTPALTADQLRKSLEKMQQHQGAVRERDRQISERRFALDAEKAKLEAAEVELAAARAAHEQADAAQTPIIAALKQKLTEAREALAVAQARRVVVEEDGRIAELRREAAALVPDDLPPTDRLVKTIEQLRREVEDGAASPWLTVQVIGRTLAAHPEQAVSAYGRELAELAEENGAGSYLESTDSLARARAALAEVKARREAIVAENAARAAKRAKLESEVRVLENGVATARQRSETVVSEAIRDAERRVDMIERDYATRVADQAGSARHVDNLAAAVRELHDRVALLYPIPPALDHSIDDDAIGRVKADLALVEGKAALVAELVEIDNALALAGARLECARAVEWALQRVREEQLAETGAGMVGAMARFLRAAGRAEVPYLDARRDACEIGWVREDGNKVAVEVLSTGEWTLFCAAISAALLDLRGGSIKLLLIEGGECDARNMLGLSRAAMAWAEETGGTALILTAHPQPDNPIESTPI